MKRTSLSWLFFGRFSGGQVFLPLPGVRGHVDRDPKTEPSPHDPNAQPQVSGGADRDRVSGEQAELSLSGHYRIVISRK